MNKLQLISLVLVACLLVISQSGCGQGSATDPRVTTTTTVVTTTGAPTTTVTSTTTTTTTTTTTVLAMIAGKVKFAGTNDGIRGGVEIVYTGAVSGVVTADAATGTYEITGLSAGSYNLSARRPDWLTSSESFSLGDTAAHLALYPMSWEVIKTGTETFNSIASSDATGKMYLCGTDAGGQGIVYICNDPTNLASWSNYTYGGCPTPEAGVNLLSVKLAERGAMPFGIVLSDAKSGIWATGTLESDAFAFASAPITNPLVQNIPGATALYNIAFADGQFVIPDDGKLYYTTDFGNSFSALSGEADTYWRGLFAYNGSNPDVLLAGTGGRVRYYTAGAWTTSAFQIGDGTETLGAAVIVIGVGGGDAALGSENGSIYYCRGSLDVPTDWHRVLSGIPYPIRAFYAQDDGGGAGALAVGGGGLIMRRR